MNVLPFVILLSSVFLLNLPFGYYREGTRKFSIQWFLAIHLPIPAIYFIRKAENITTWVIPFSLVFAIAGQIVGARIRQKISPVKIEPKGREVVGS